MNRAYALIVGLFLVSASTALAENVVNSIQLNNEGVKAIEREDLNQAEQFFLQSLAGNPFDPHLHLNLGLTYELQKRYDRALKQYQSVLRLKSVSDELKFIAHFNSGNAAAQSQDVDGALKHFQNALAIDPKSEETKKNIELLMASGSGQGKGNNDSKNKDQKENQDGEGDANNDQEQQQDDKPNEEKKDKKKEFKSENLTKDDVKKIMEEIKSQEKKIRALEFGDKTKEGQPGKDW